MTMIRQLMARASKEPMHFAAAMAAGAFGPAIITQTLNTGTPAGLSPLMLAMASGAATFYMLDDSQDTTSMIVGAGAGYLGPMVRSRMNVPMGLPTG